MSKQQTNKNHNKATDDASNSRQKEQPGAPSKSNRQTGGNKRHERDNSNDRNDERQDTKKGPNSIWGLQQPWILFVVVKYSSNCTLL